MEKKLKNLTILVITKNEANRIGICLKSAQFAQKIVVLDSGSTDNTCNIADSYQAEVINFNSNDFSELRNEILKYADTDWVMYLDADEIITPELAAEIGRIVDTDNITPTKKAYFVKRNTYYFGNYLWPKSDKLERLFWHKNLLKWAGKVHESPVIIGDVGVLNYSLAHYTHRDLTEMVNKTNNWSDIEADLRLKANHPSVIWWRLLRVMWTGYTSSYFRDLGYKAGTIGIIESIYQSFSMFITYAKLWEKQEKII